jgi:tRNA 2-thiouridine synthesizing protein B
MLHIVNKSPFERNSLESCLRLAQAGDALLLIEDAVVAASAGQAHAARLREALERISIHVLAPDLAARGLKDRALAGVELVDYGGFVDLVTRHSPVQSWL